MGSSKQAGSSKEVLGRKQEQVQSSELKVKKLESVLASQLQRLYRDQGVLVVDDQDQRHPRVFYFCTLCSKWAFTDASLADHLQGKRHAKAIAASPVPPSLTLPSSPWKLVTHPPPGKGKGHGRTKPDQLSLLTADATAAEGMGQGKGKHRLAPAPGEPWRAPKVAATSTSQWKSMDGRPALEKGRQGGGATRSAGLPLPLPPWKLAGPHVPADIPRGNRVPRTLLSFQEQKSSGVQVVDGVVQEKGSRGSVDDAMQEAKRRKWSAEEPGLPSVSCQPERIPQRKPHSGDMETPAMIPTLKAEVLAMGTGCGSEAAPELALMVLDYSDDLGRGSCSCRCLTPAACSCGCVCVGCCEKEAGHKHVAAQEALKDGALKKKQDVKETAKGQGDGGPEAEGPSATAADCPSVEAEGRQEPDLPQQQRMKRRKGSRARQGGLRTGGSVSERHCFICGQGLHPGEKVGAPWNVETSQPACSSRNDHGKFHIFHVDCLRDWLVYSRASVQMQQGRSSRKPSGPPECLDMERPEGQEESPKGHLLPSCSLSSDEDDGGPGRVRGQLWSEGSERALSHHGGGASQEEDTVMANAAVDVGEGNQRMPWAEMEEVFCPECQGTGRRQLDGALEHPRYRLSEVYDWILEVLLARRASAAEDEEEGRPGLHPKVLGIEAPTPAAAEHGTTMAAIGVETPARKLDFSHPQMDNAILEASKTLRILAHDQPLEMGSRC